MSEKRHFKIHASEKNEMLMLLFDCLGNMDKYDKAAIRRFYNRERSGSPLSQTLRRLYYMILDTLCRYYSESSPDARIRKHLHYAEILLERGLYPQGQVMLTKAGLLADSHGRHAIMPEITGWMIVTQPDIVPSAGLQGALKKEGASLRILTNIHQYRLIQARMFPIIKQTEYARSSRGAAPVEQLMRHPLLRSGKYALSPEARYMYYGLRTMYHYYKNNTANYYKELVRTKELLAHCQDRIFRGQARYINTLNNLINALHGTGRYHEALAAIKNLRSSMKNSSFILPDMAASLLIRELNYYIFTGRFLEGIQVAVRQGEAGQLNIPAAAPHHRMVIHYNLAYLYFGAGDLGKSLEQVNRILNTFSKSIYRQDIIAFTHFLNLIIHYELNHHDVLPYLFKSAYRYLYTRKLLHEPEILLLPLFNKASSVNIPGDREQMKAIFTELKAGMEVITKNPGNKVLLAQFDFIAWLESKISGRSFADIVRNKAMQNTPIKPGK